MSTAGTIFDIKQLSVFDGPGIRTTVFLKGCPLRCMWCHNPEGLSFKPQIMKSDKGCIGCGSCREACRHPEGCILCGSCVRACPRNLIRICGRQLSSEELAEHLLKDKEYLSQVQGGVTFSGGEPLGQPEFLKECLKRLEGIHRCIETSGYCESRVFQEITELLDYVIMDIKLADDERHRHFTGAGNEVIKRNLEYLKERGKPFRIRIPVIPGVNDSLENFRETARLLKGARGLERVELLPYHMTAGAKYRMVGMDYEPEFDEERAPAFHLQVFEEAGIPCRRL